MASNQPQETKQPINKTGLVVGSVIVVILIIVGIIVAVSRKDNTNPTPNQQNNNDISKVADPAALVLHHPNDPRLGPQQAQVTVVEFSDFQCPACAISAEIMKKIYADHEKAGDLAYVYRHNPLPQHKYAMTAAAAAMFAQEKGKFWEMHDLIFKNQPELATSQDAIATLVSFGQKVGISAQDQQKMAQDLQSGRFLPIIELGQKEFRGYGITSSPTLFINGQKYTGPYDYKSISQKINDITNAQTTAQ